MRKIAKITVAIIAIALVLWFAILYFGPDRCPLCDFIKSLTLPSLTLTPSRLHNFSNNIANPH